jgi:hypothetical protein
MNDPVFYGEVGKPGNRLHEIKNTYSTESGSDRTKIQLEAIEKLFALKLNLGPVATALGTVSAFCSVNPRLVIPDG